MGIKTKLSTLTNGEELYASVGENVDLGPVSKMKIFVKAHTGKTLTLDVAAEDLVEMFKWQLRIMTGVPGRKMRLLFGCKQLEDGRSLRDYNIQKECTVHMVMRLPASKLHLDQSEILN